LRAVVVVESRQMLALEMVVQGELVVVGLAVVPVPKPVQVHLEQQV